jgi:hypothetical protein
MTKLSLDFELTNLDLRYVLLRPLTTLDQTLDDGIEWPTDDEFEVVVSFLNVEVHEEFPDLSAIVDETEVRIPNHQIIKTERILVKKETSTFSLNYVGLYSKIISHLCI